MVAIIRIDPDAGKGKKPIIIIGEHYAQVVGNPLSQGFMPSPNPQPRMQNKDY